MIFTMFSLFSFFFFNDTATTEIYTLSLHDALPISTRSRFSPSARSRPSPTWSPSAGGFARAAHSPTPGSRSDRKSTRLNSSHSQISYAVFCLKKKKKNIPLHETCEHNHIHNIYYHI